MNKRKIKQLNKNTEYEYYKGFGLDELRNRLTTILRETRQEPGLQIAEIAEICKSVFCPDEIKSLIKELNK